MERVAITGAGGFLGSHLVRRLTRDGVTLRAHLGPEEGEIDQLSVIEPVVEGAAVVFHLAGPASVVGSFAAPAEYARIHVAGTATVLEACRRQRVGRVVYVSSAEVYGRPERNPVVETDRLAPRSPYGAAKVGAEHMIDAFRRSHGLEAAVLRPFSVYGPGQSTGGVMAALLGQVQKAQRGESTDAITLFDLTPVRDFCFVGDLVDALVRAATAPLGDGPHVFNVGTGRGTSIGELAGIAVEVAGLRLPVTARADRDRPATSDLTELIADATRIHAALGWSATTSLADGLRATLKAMVTEGGG